MICSTTTPSDNWSSSSAGVAETKPARGVSARNSSNINGRLSSALGRRNPYSTSVSLRARSPLNMPAICGRVTWDSSTTTRKSSGK